ncbi:ubiquitin-like-conjugating enzyme ATG10 [Pectinophora gossypiella]|uniref:ubiquitin-like-conjugating enzyme ATG10 n=1 Tax=Pectinophora gossypiella TaxID=13191 RepID=UPI00214F4D74|nr:ubiquitin-like-conjugating enzyme ATG10 [Pectinophora gossypiella]
MDSTTLTVEEFLKSAEDFEQISDRLNDGWTLHKNSVDLHKSFIRKETFLVQNGEASDMVKVDYVIFYNLSYGVPSFSFNMWNSSGVFLTLDEIREMSFVRINKKDFYSIITQQEHPIFLRPYFVMHPCQTEDLLATFRKDSKNIIVTFLSLITPLIRLNLPLEYGL